MFLIRTYICYVGLIGKRIEENNAPYLPAYCFSFGIYLVGIMKAL